MADVTGPRGPQGPAGTSIPLPLAIADGGTGATTAKEAAALLGVPTLASRYTIPAGSDLNAYTEVGCYCCTGNSEAQSLANCPTLSAFILDVGWANGSNYYLSQTIREHATGTVYYRNHNTGTGTWGTWYKFEGVAVS